MHIFLLIILIILPQQVYAEPILKVEVNEYNIYTKDPDRLLSDLNEGSPVRENGEIYHAYTDTYVDWRYWWDKNEHSCKLNKVETTVNITYTLPRLDENNASSPVIDIWRLYYPALVKHEKGHGQIAIDAARKIENTLIHLPPCSDCSLLSQVAKLKAEEILSNCRPKHQEYDRRTNHGKTEGANIELYLP